METVLFIIKHVHCECCAGFITLNRWQLIFQRRLAIAMALHVLDAELILLNGMLDADEEGKYTGPTDLKRMTVESWEEFFLSDSSCIDLLDTSRQSTESSSL